MGAHQNNESLRSALNSIPANISDIPNTENEVQNEVIDIKAIKEDMKSLSKAVLDIVTSNKKFDLKEAKRWGDDLIYGIRTLLKRRYPQYAYCICVYMSDPTGYVANDRTVLYRESDIQFVLTSDTNKIYSHVRVCAYKKRPPKNNFENNLHDYGLINNINKLLNRQLSGKTFEFQRFKPLLVDIVNGINELLLARDNKPCSYNVTYINKLPMRRFYFDFKIFEVDYYPIFFNYSNDSFICRDYLFLLNL